MHDCAPTPLREPPLGSLISGVRSRLVQVYQARVADLGLTAQQYWVLMVLQEEGPLCLRQVAERVWCDEPTASRLLKALLKGGWVTVGPDPAHGRRLRIQVAETRRPQIDALHREALGLRQGLRAGLTAEEEAQLRALLLRLLHNLDHLEARKG